MKKKAVKKVYVASKYAGDVEANVMAARAYCRRVIEEGYMPMASHLLYPQFVDDNILEERRLGMSFGFEMMKLCDEVWVFGTVSSGVAEEVVKAEENGITVRSSVGETRWLTSSRPTTWTLPLSGGTTC